MGTPAHGLLRIDRGRVLHHSMLSRYSEATAAAMTPALLALLFVGVFFAVIIVVYRINRMD